MLDVRLACLHASLRVGGGFCRGLGLTARRACGLELAARCLETFVGELLGGSCRRIVDEEKLAERRELTAPRNLCADRARIGRRSTCNETRVLHRALPFDDWMLYVMQTPAAHANRPLITGAMYRRDGTRVVTVAQEGLIRPRTPQNPQG